MCGLSVEEIIEPYKNKIKDLEKRLKDMETNIVETNSLVKQILELLKNK